MKKITACLLALSTLGSFAEGERTLSEDGKTLTFDIAAGAVYTNTVIIETSVTNIVKIGGGEACFVPQTNDVYKGGIVIKEGFLTGLQRSFGKPASITVESDSETGVGGALVFLDLMPGALATTACPFWNTKWHLSGSGPDGTGALQRPVTHCDHVINGFAKEVWLDADTTINCGSRYGFAGTTLYMNNHKLTVTASRTTWPGSATKHNQDYSRIFQFARSGNLTIKDPGEVFVTGTCRLLLEGGSQVLDAAGSNGSVSNMLVTIDTNCQLRVFSTGLSAAPVFKTRYLNSGAFNVNGSGHYKGSAELMGPSFTFAQYSDASHAYLYGGLSGPARVSYWALADYDLLGDTTNYLNGITHGGSGRLTYGDSAVFYVTNSYFIGSTSLARPAQVDVKGNAKLLTCDETRVKGVEKRLLVGSSAAADANQYGILRIDGNAVVSNQISIGYFGRGAVYLSGNGELDFLDGWSGNNAFITGNQGTAGKAYGYLGMTGGTAREDFWFNIGGNGNTRAFIVQKGGRFEHNGSGEPVRFGFSGLSHCAYAQYGGTSVWKNYAAFGFANYTPSCVSTVGSLTVAGEGTLMDFSGSGGYSGVNILCNANTNAVNPNSVNINVNDAGTLYVRKIARGQIVNNSPDWASLTNMIAEGSQYYLNFNGGIIKTAKEGEFFNSTATDSVRELTRVTVYEKGAIIDTAGTNVIWRMALEKPYGLGIQSVALPAEVLATTATNLFIGPTRPVVDGLSRQGRTTDLMLAFDEVTRRVTNVIVNARGFGFTSTPTVVFEKGNPADTTTWACTPTMVNFDDPAFLHGGLTKRGDGTLTLTGANTYGGATRLEGGTLAFTHADGLPAGDLEFSAAALASGDKAQPLLTALSLPAVAERRIRVTEAETLDRDAFGKIRVAATFATAPAALPAVEFVDSDGAPIDMPAWAFTQSNGGRTLNFGYCRGTVLVLR